MMRVWGTAQDGIGTNQREGETLDERFDAASSGDRRALARLLSSIENGELKVEEPQRNDSDWNILALNRATWCWEIMSSRSYAP